MNRNSLYILLLILPFGLFSQNNKSLIKEIYGRVAVSYSKGSNQSMYLFDPLAHSEFNQNEYSTPSLGESILANFGAGFMLHPNFGIESNFSYLSGLNVDLYTFNSAQNRVSAYTKNTQVIWLPTTVFRVQIKKFQPYVKVGLMVPLMNYSKLYYTIASNNAQNEYQYKINNELNLGINGCVGVAYKLSNKLDIFFEVEEDNIRSFHKEAFLESKVENAIVSMPQPVGTYYQFVNKANAQSASSDVLSFPISFNREAYTLGLKYKF